MTPNIACGKPASLEARCNAIEGAWYSRTIQTVITILHRKLKIPNRVPVVRDDERRDARAGEGRVNG